MDAVEFFVQGSLTTSQLLYIGIYDSDATTGMPTNLLWQIDTAYDIAAGGTGTKTISTPTLTPTTGRVWVAYYLTNGSSQFVTGSPSGIAESEMGIAPGGAINATIQSLNCNAAWSGVMPNIYTYDPAGSNLSTAGNYINFFLRLPA